MNYRSVYKELRTITIALFLVTFSLETIGANLESGLKIIQSIPLQSFEHRLSVIDSLQNCGDLTAGIADTERCIVYFAKGKKRMAMKYGEKAISDKTFVREINNRIIVKEQMTLYDNLAKTYLDLRYNSKAISVAIQCLELAKQTKDRSVIASQYLTTGTIHYECGDKKSFKKYVLLAIDELTDMHDGKSMINLSYIYGMYVNYLVKDEKYQEALQYCRLREKLIDKLYNLPKLDEAKLSELDRQRGYLYCKMAYVLSKLGQKEEAKTCYAKFYSTKFSKVPSQELDIVAYLLTVNDNDNVIKKVKSILPLFENDTIDSYYSGCLDYLSEAYAGNRDYKTAMQYITRSRVIKDSLAERKNEALAVEIGEIYESSQKDALISKQELQLLLLISIILVFMILLIGGGVYIYRVKVYNKRLYRISLLRNKEMAQNRIVNKIHRTADAYLDSRNNLEQYNKLIDEILTKKLFVSPTFGRKDMCAMLATNENYLYRIFNECAGDSVANVLNNIKLDYSIELISKKMDKDSVEQIALNSGFNNVRTFQRLFKTRFGLSPTEFLRQHQAARHNANKNI